MINRPSRIVAAIGLCAATLAVAQTSVRPGEYEFMIEMRLPDLPQPITEMRKECISPEEVATFWERMRADVAAAGETCKLAEPVFSGNKVTWDSDCEGGKTAKSELTFTSEGFSGVIRAVSDGNVLPFNITARWVGATCTDEDNDDENDDE